MRALVLWADDRSTNLGVRALASGTAALVHRVWPDATIELQAFRQGAAPVPVNTRALLAALSRTDRSLVEWLAGYDLVVDTRAGDSFADIYGLKRLAFMTALTKLSTIAGTKVVMGPQTIGPFGTAVGRRVGRYALDKADVVMARDHASATYASEMGRPVDVLSTDVVFALPVPVVPRTRDVVLNVSGLLWHPGPHVDAEQYRRAVLDVHRRLTAQGRTVSLLAHVIDADGPDNDVPAIRAVASLVDPEAEVIVPATLNEVREVTASAQLVIASRMHACLNALSVGTPAIPLAYSRKFAPLLQDLGWRHTIDLRTDDDIPAKVAALAADDGLSAQVAPVVSRAAAFIDAAVDFLAGHTGQKAS